MFRIRPMHDKINKKLVNNFSETKKTEKKEEPEIVFILDEETGEITQEVKRNDNDEETIIFEGQEEETEEKSVQPLKEKIPNKYSGLSMKKNIKSSFY